MSTEWKRRGGGGEKKEGREAREKEEGQDVGTAVDGGGGRTYDSEPGPAGCYLEHQHPPPARGRAAGVAEHVARQRGAARDRDEQVQAEDELRPADVGREARRAGGGVVVDVLGPEDGVPLQQHRGRVHCQAAQDLVPVRLRLRGDEARLVPAAGGATGASLRERPRRGMDRHRLCGCD